MLVAKVRSVHPIMMQRIWDVLQRNGGLVKGFKVFVNMLASTPNCTPDEMRTVVTVASCEYMIMIRENVQEKGVNCRCETWTITLPPLRYLDRRDHDWYCFKCHGAGEILQCKSCPRVYHYGCLGGARKPKKNVFICPCCHIIASKPSMEDGTLSRQTLNHILHWMIVRNERGHKAHRMADGESYAVCSSRPVTDSWRFAFLIHTPMDWETMKAKAISEQYTCLEEFQVDFETMIHDISVYFGAQSNQKIAARFSDILKEFEDARLCIKCYERDFRRNKASLLCLPCPVEHDVVWPRREESYWPAKLLKVEGEKLYVRFFGDNVLTKIDDGFVLPLSPRGIEELKENRARAYASDVEWNVAYAQFQTYQQTIERNRRRRKFDSKKKTEPATMDGNDSNNSGGKRPRSGSSQQNVAKKLKSQLGNRNENVASVLTASSAMSPSQGASSASTQNAVSSTSTDTNSG